MAQTQWIQGSWEELLARSEEFKSQSNLLLIIPGDTEIKNVALKEGMSLAEALKGRTGLVSFEPTDLSENTGKKFADLLVEKYRNEQE